MDKKDAIYNALLAYVSQNGIGKISSKKLAKAAGVGEGTIFLYYNTIRNLLDECAIRYDRELMNICINYIKDNHSLSEVWDYIMEYLLQNSDGANFYFAYVYYYGFKPTEANTRALEYLEVAKFLFVDKEHLSDHQILLFWDYFTTQLFYYCNKISTNQMENSIENKEFIKKIVFTTYDNI